MMGTMILHKSLNCGKLQFAHLFTGIIKQDLVHRGFVGSNEMNEACKTCITCIT